MCDMFVEMVPRPSCNTSSSSWQCAQLTLKICKVDKAGNERRGTESGAGEDSFYANKRGPKQNIKKKHGKTMFSVVVSFFYLLENNITPKLMGRRSPNLFGCIFLKVETTARIVKGA